MAHISHEARGPDATNPGREPALAHLSRGLSHARSLTDRCPAAGPGSKARAAVIATLVASLT
jgi:hypothetical protein